MKNLRVLVRERLLREAAVSASRAAAQGYALVRDETGTKYCLIDPDYLDSEIALISEDDPQVLTRVPKLAHALAMTTVIVGYLWLTGTSDPSVMQVDVVAAKSGYGPLMYDIAMSHRFITSAVNGDTSPDAEGVWKRYYKRDDVAHVEFPQKRAVKPWLAQAYRLQTPVDVGSLTDNYDLIQNQLAHVVVPHVLTRAVLMAGSSWAMGEING